MDLQALGGFAGVAGGTSRPPTPSPEALPNPSRAVHGHSFGAGHKQAAAAAVAPASEPMNPPEVQPNLSGAVHEHSVFNHVQCCTSEAAAK